MQHPDHRGELIPQPRYRARLLQRVHRVLERLEYAERLVEIEHQPRWHRIVVGRVHVPTVTRGV